MQNYLELLAKLISDYRLGEIAPPDADHVGRWISQFDKEEHEPVVRELAYVWEKIYASRKRTAGFLQAQVENGNITGGDHAAFWESTSVMDIQNNGHSQKEMRKLFGHAVRDKLGITIKEADEADNFVYLDDVLFTGGRIQQDLMEWIVTSAPDEARVYIILLAVHRFGLWQTESRLNQAARAAGKKIDFHFMRIASFENRKLYRNDSDVLWPVQLPLGAEAYKDGKTAHEPRTPGGKSQLFSSEGGRQILEQALLKAGLKIRAFSANPAPILRPLGFGPFGVGFGSLFLSSRNCPNNAPLALWWGDPEMPATHPFSKWQPLVPRKTYGGDN